MLNKKEQASMDGLVFAWNNSDELSPDDRHEFKLAIHSAQNILLAQPTQRAMAKDKAVNAFQFQGLKARQFLCDELQHMDEVLNESDKKD